MVDPRSTRSVLVLTPIDAAWAGDSDVTLLGPWCLPYARHQASAARSPRTLPDPWRSRSTLHDAHAYVTALHQRLVPPLAAALNRLHGVERSTHYWHVMLGAWLLSFLPAVYQRHRTLDAAFETNPEFSTCGLTDACFVTPRTTIDLPRLIIGDHYNLQLYTRLLKAAGRCGAVREARPSPIDPVGGSGWRRRVKQWAGAVSRHLPSRHAVLANTTLFPREALLELAWRLRGQFRPLFPAPAVGQDGPIRPDARAALREAVAADDRFTSLLRDILPFELPTCFVEGYAALAASEAAFPPPPAAILSANAWYYDESFKHWAASAHERGTRLLGIQHGGNYGGGDHLPSEWFEIELVDRFYTWGWHKAAYGDRTCPMPAPKFVGRPAVGASNARRGLLLATTHMTRYPLNFLTSVGEFEAYLDAHRRFVAALPAELRRALRVRLHRDDFGWDLAARWRDFAPDVSMDSNSTPFQDSLRDCRIYVCDHHSTTFIEALSVDKPTVLFWDPGTVDIAPEYADRYAALREAGILHDTPEAAARRLDTVHDDVERWWRGGALQQARRHFCEALGRTAADAAAQWTAELRRQIGPGTPGWPRRAR